MKQQKNNSTEKGFSIDDILVQLQVVFRRFRLVTLCCCLVLTLGLIYFCYARPIYKAVSSVECVFFRDKSVKPGFFSNRTGVFELRARLPSRTISELAAKELGINMGFRGIMQKYINRVRVYQDSGAENFTQSKLQVEVLSYDAEIGKQWAEALVKVFAEYREKEREVKADFALENARRKMDETSSNLSSLSSERRSLEERMQFASLVIEQNELKNLPKDITFNERAIEQMEQIMADLKIAGLSIKEKFSILGRYDDNEQDKKIGELKEQMKKVENEPIVLIPQMTNADEGWIRADLDYEKIRKNYIDQSKVFGPRHPTMLTLKGEMDKAKEALQLKFDAAMQAFEFKYEKRRQDSIALKNLYPRYLQVNKEIEEVKRQLSDIDKKIQENTRRRTLLRDQIEKVSTAFEQDPIISITYKGLKEMSDGSISPNKGKLLIYCAGGALLLGISMAYLLEYMDSSVKAPENVELELQIFGLGIVPELNSKGDVDLLQVHEAFPMFKESFRVIRTNLILRRDEMGKGQVMMLSSSMPQEGKSLCSLELARSFAELGNRTLLIDADLRRGKQTRKLTGKKVAGLAEFLTGKPQVEPVQFEENLDFLPAGHYSSQAIESLGGQSLRALIMGFRMQYDQIVVDGPPLLGLPDVFMMKEFLDGMVIVVSAGHTAFPQLKLAVEQVQKSKIPIHGFILNLVNFNTGGKYYRYYYRNYEYYNQGVEGGTAIIPPVR